MSWYCYLEEKLNVPFKARCRSKREISPLCVREEVDVLGMASETECESEMFVQVRWHRAKIAVPLSQLKPLTADPETTRAITDWHYWVARGYQF